MISAKIGRALANRVLLVAIIFGGAFAGATLQAAPDAPIFPEKTLTLYADSPNNTVGGIIHLRNDSNKEDQSISLTAGDFISKTTEKGLNAKVLFLGPGDSAGKPIFETTLAKKKASRYGSKSATYGRPGNRRRPCTTRGRKSARSKPLSIVLNVKLVGGATDKPEIQFHEGVDQQVTSTHRENGTLTITVGGATPVEGSGKTSNVSPSIPSSSR